MWKGLDDMNQDQKIHKTAVKLVGLLDKEADRLLPQQIVDVVKLHSKLAVGSAWVPIPGVDVAAGAATIWTMYARINNKIGLPFGENVMKSIASGVATNLASYLAMTGVASALKFIPGLGTIGGAAIASVALYALTLTSGYVYLEALCKLCEKKDLNHISINDVSESVNNVLSNDSEIKEFMDEAKKEYKKNR